MSFADALVKTVGSAISSASGTAIDIAKRNREEAIKREGWDRQDQRTADERTYQEGRTAEQRDYQEDKTAEDRAYQKGLSADERTYQQELTSEERSYQEGQAEVKRGQKLEDEATTFDRQKELLKVKDSGKKTKQKKEDLTKAADAYSAGNDTLELIDNIKAHPGFESRVGAKGASSLFGLFDTPVAGTDAAGADALIDTLGSKNFMNSIGQMKGMGALSNAEGLKVSAAVSSLDPNMPEEDFRNSLDVIYDITQRGMDKQREILASSGYDISNLPSLSDTGGKGSQTGVVMSHESYGDVTEDDIAETMRANNMTREEVLSRLGGQ
ncbi:released from the phage upon host infection [Vibrio phage 219E48-1]|nr:hypothetical protein PODOV021v1_p0006 [Vibrio phage 219E41.2]QZI91036.1 hypothetical protein PODOV032v1_p0031 [Vibrio phage 219E41.1]QZI91147.1 hypothetical protein PODOV060v1_p0053 [Vibrio phage 234P8]QZI91656.1 hypothetical protein PODOV086v1_p0072 [Vibrio phage 431E46.1]QZI91689.1 hypothetical protein PODOV088v1_p0028 [Vibrio phage 431E48.2]